MVRAYALHPRLWLLEGSITKNLNFDEGIFNNTEHAVKTIYGELGKPSTSKFY